jgi:hypothetical protein
MPEIIAAYERDGGYFGAIKVLLSGEPFTFEFAVEQLGYMALRKILQSHPFGETQSIVSRYFYMGSFTRRELDKEPVTFGIRIESGKNAKTCNFDGPTSLLSNLIWFASLKEPEQASALKRLPQTR